MSRCLAWFSCGAASAVAARNAIDKYGMERVLVCRIRIATEHPDNDRFAKDVASWLGVKIVELKSEKYADPFDVYEKTKFLVGPYGARCTTELKKAVRKNFQLSDDIHIFGFTADKRDLKRAERMRDANFDLNLEFPLIEAGVTKARCFAELMRAGIHLPTMYSLGFENNNCIGCVKGGAGYWNKIRIHFPVVFARMVEIETKLGRTVLRKKNKPYPLKNLIPNTGADIDDSGCSFLCGV